MRIARFRTDGGSRWGFVEGTTIRQVTGGVALLDVLGDLSGLAELAQQASDPIPIQEADLLAPITNPPQFLGIGLNYREHAAESGVAVPTSPVSFPFFNSSIIGPGDPIELPPFTREVDWEVELGVVIGKPARNVAVDRALDYVAGYVIVNDLSARDIQMGEGQWSRGKSFDTFKPMGPWITTVDELGAADNLDVKLWVNDEIKQSGNTSDLIFNVAELVSHMSQSLTLGVGAVISTGTPSGVGFARKPPEFLRSGDIVTLEIEGIGKITNPVIES